MRRLLLMAASAGVLAGVVLGATACGDTASDGGGGAPGTGTLQITYIPEPGVKPRMATLTCPADSSDGMAACEQIESLTPAFDPVAPDTACTDIYGGPEQINLYGTWAGETVDTTLTRTNGCEIDRYRSVAPVLLPLVGA